MNRLYGITVCKYLDVGILVGSDGGLSGNFHFCYFYSLY